MIKNFTGIFAAINREDTDLSKYKRLCIDKLEKSSIEEFWNIFGYVLFGAFRAASYKREELLERLSENSIYIQSIFKAAYFDREDDIAYNKKCLLEIFNGAKEFSQSYDAESLSEIQNIIINYIDNDIDTYIKYRLLEIYNIEKINDIDYKIPVNKSGRMRFGIIDPWCKELSGELEAISRISAAAEYAGIESVRISDKGYILYEEDKKAGEEFVEAKDLDFVITMQYLTYKGLDTFYYHTLWNPPQMPLGNKDYADYITDNYLMNDDYLIYDNGGMKNHLKTILLNKNRNLDNTSMLTASFPQSHVLEPNLDDPKLFYCGMNWELLNKVDRHGGLFKLLDDTGKVKFFGPDVMKSWGNLRPWDGYKCYQYPIPWDGFSILDEINKCGICLAISSDMHRRAGAVTNRVYEACAAGAVIISDNNDFMLKYFKDAALFIYYNKDNPKDTFNQIMEKYEWVINNKEEAKALVKKAQDIFIDKFALDKQLLRIVQNHPERFNSVKKDLFAVDENKNVLVTYVLDSKDKNTIEHKLSIIIANIRRQYYRNIDLVIICDALAKQEVRDYLDKNFPFAKVEALELFDEKNIRYMSNGKAIREVQKKYSHSYFVNTSINEKWHYDHITSLIRTIEDENSLGAYSGRLYLDKNNNHTYPEFFDIYTDEEIYIKDESFYTMPGQFMFTNLAHSYVEDCVMEFLDGIEHCAYINILRIKYGKDVSFDKRMTIVRNSYTPDEKQFVIDIAMQKRLIQDIVRYKFKERNAQFFSTLTAESEGINNSKLELSVRETILNLPVKAWFKYKFYIFMARRKGYNSEKGQKYIQKAESMKNIFLKK